VGQCEERARRHRGFSQRFAGDVQVLDTVAADQRSGSRSASRNSGKSLKLVEYTGRLFRQGKASIAQDLAGIFERLGLSAQRWQHGMEKLRGDRLVGRFFAASRAKLREIADRIGVRHLVNLTGCPIR
jgi:hypothetical protein